MFVFCRLGESQANSLVEDNNFHYFELVSQAGQYLNFRCEILKDIWRNANEIIISQSINQILIQTSSVFLQMSPVTPYFMSDESSNNAKIICGKKNAVKEKLSLGVYH